MRRTVPPSAEIEKRIDELLAAGVAVGDAEGPLSELAKLVARLIIQRAVRRSSTRGSGAPATSTPEHVP